MTFLEIAALLAALAFAVLVGCLIPVLVQLRKTAAESEQLVKRLGVEVPLLISELRAVSQNVSALTGQARDGVEHASVLLHAVGEVGESVQQVHDVVRGSSGTLLGNVVSMVAGLRAAAQFVRERYQQGGPHNGG
ncbi:hypothetical protein W02_13010 [Nitrospira sp. KM1]|uniref:DUF948 domain-containing protein n=1 Tax=Nitrospira sp. KM1 TaxID=1936990 RepID=UPI0013A72680|nr:DUF948 domain-containing protein [Nitrospira sp. KM1]BCA54161.1 hypothetical protein W02_13010 [Nitrospira sp. KM1]